VPERRVPSQTEWGSPYPNFLLNGDPMKALLALVAVLMAINVFAAETLKIQTPEVLT
jgi:hypothetical protein